MSVHVGDGLPAARVPQQVHGVGDDGLASGRGHCIDEPPEAGDRIVLDDLVDARHLESVVQVPSLEGRGEQDIIAPITAHENAPRGRHDVLFLGISAHERTEIVARQTDVLEHGLHHGKVRWQFYRYANVTLDNSEYGSGTHVCQDLLWRHRPPHRRRRENAASRHFFTARSLPTARRT